jgi:hypothetical protein
MKFFYIIIGLLGARITWAAPRSILEGKNGECGVTTETLRTGNIAFTSIPCIILNIVNNLLQIVGIASIMVIVFGSLFYVFSGVSESAKEK